jgi:hypothetical protein
MEAKMTGDNTVTIASGIANEGTVTGMCPICGLRQRMFYSPVGNVLVFMTHDCQPMREVLEARIAALEDALHVEVRQREYLMGDIVRLQDKVAKLEGDDQ